VTAPLIRVGSSGSSTPSLETRARQRRRRRLCTSPQRFQSAPYFPAHARHAVPRQRAPRLAVLSVLRSSREGMSGVRAVLPSALALPRLWR